MPVPVTSNFDDDSIKNERASLETAFSHYKSMGIFFSSRAANSVVSGPICKYKKDQIKHNQEKVETSFSPL